MRRAVALVATVALLAWAVVAGRQRSQDPTQPASTPSTAMATPEQCIERMFAAAEKGDISAYLACFAGAERDRIQREIQQTGAALFRQSLIDAVAPLKGWAIHDNQPVGEFAELAVERVYQHHNERQVYRLSRDSGEWRIVGIAGSQPMQAPIPYGTPVFEPPADSDAAPAP